MASSGTRAAGRAAAQRSAAPMTAKVAPMSRTKCSFSGPVCGTPAGRPWYQPGGSASIHAALPRLSRPVTPSTAPQLPAGDDRCMRLAPSPRRCAPRTPGQVPAGHPAEERDALGDARRLEAGERKVQRALPAPVEVEDLAARVGDARLARRAKDALGIDAAGER